MSALVIQVWHSKVKLSYYRAKLCVFHKRKFTKLTPKTQVSFGNEAPGVYIIQKIN
jgi:hypothetical protein